MTEATETIADVKSSVRQETPNTITKAALDEGDKMLLNPSSKRFHSADELFEDLDAE